MVNLMLLIRKLTEVSSSPDDLTVIGYLQDNSGPPDKILLEKSGFDSYAELAE